MTFEDCLTIVLKFEGGFSNDPRDSGGPTQMGITQRTLSDWRGAPATAEDVQALTVADVEPIYRAGYWDKCRCAEMPSGLDLLVFDAAVNSGPTNAIKFLQRALNVQTDGILGPKTMTALQAADPKALVQEVAVRRAVHYAGLQVVFRLGWYRRLLSVYATALAAGE